MLNTTSPLHVSQECLYRSFGPSDCDGHFDFTLLFEQTVLSITPSAIFLVVLLQKLFYLRRSNRKTFDTSIRELKLFIAVLLVASQLALLVAWNLHSQAQTVASVPAASLALVASLGLILLSFLEHDRSIRPSTLIVVFLIPSILFDAVQIRTLSLNKVSGLIAGLLCVVITLKLFLLVLESLSKRRWLLALYRNLPPEATSGAISRSLFWWLNSLFLDGFRRILAHDDLFAIDQDLMSQKISLELEEAYTLNHVTSRWTLPKACIRCLWKDIFAMIPMRLCLIGFTYAQTFLFTRAIHYLGQHDAPKSMNVGYGLIGATFIIYVGIAISNALYQRSVYRILTKCRGAMIAMIYNCALKIADGTHTESAALTLMSTDVDTITRVLSELNESWARLIEVAIGIGLLSRQVGAICVVPLVLAFFSTQGQAWVSKRIGTRRKDWLGATQKRIGITASILGSIQSARLSGLMTTASNLIRSLRVNELGFATIFLRFVVGLNALATIPSIWAPVLTFVVYAIKARARGEAGLDVAQAFTSLSLLTLVTTPTTKLLTIMPLWAQALGCFERLQAYLQLPFFSDGRLTALSVDRHHESLVEEGASRGQVFEMMTMHSKAQGTSRSTAVVACRDLEISQRSKDSIILSQITFEAHKGSLTILTGPTGCGKTTLVKCLLGEIQCVRGWISISTPSIAYCSQVPWLTNSTVRDLIVGPSINPEAVDELWYQSVIYACDLISDIEKMPEVDNTILGSKGISLSGGQKARLALARAVYARKDLSILDDIFSALDTRTEEIIINRLFGPSGLLRKYESTTILVTHSKRILKFADNVITLTKHGKIEYQGTPSRISEPENQGLQIDPLNEIAEEVSPPKRMVPPRGPSEEDKEDLARRTGDWTIYKFYFRTFHWIYIVLFITLSVGTAFSSSFSQIWLNWWTSDNKSNPKLYLSVFVVLAMAQSLFSTMNMWVVFLKMMPGSALDLHQILLNTVTGAASSVFYSVDSGVILNRFSQDMALVTGALPTSLIASGNMLCETLASLALISTGATYVGISIPFVLIAIYFVQKVYLKTSRQLRILDLEARSPIYSHFLETIDGTMVIRAFGWEESAQQTHFKLLDASQSPYYLLGCIQRWLKLVLDLITAALAVIVVALAVSLNGTTSAGLLGVALSNILSFSQSLNRLVTEWTTLETSLGAIARVRSFAATTEQEASAQDNLSILDGFTAQGGLSFHNVCAKYKDGPGPLDLDQVSFEIQSGQKVGICGRTGSGKSSLMLALFRLLKLQDGEIYLDGIDIKTLDQETLRQSIIAVPQQPFLLPGTLRQILDPSSALNDKDLKTALEAVHLLTLVRERGGLDANFDQQTLSQGQQQLLCLARAILRKSKVVVLDEATSNLDSSTAELVQDVLRTSFGDSAVISIAHRVETIMASDMVLMMDSGKVAAFDTPRNLTATCGDFRKLCGVA